jgi:hypothetical protein
VAVKGGAHPAGKTYLPKRKIPSKVYLSGYTKGGIWLMEVIFEELNVPPKAGLEVELGTFVPLAAYVGHHHQRKEL